VMSVSFEICRSGYVMPVSCALCCHKSFCSKLEMQVREPVQRCAPAQSVGGSEALTTVSQRNKKKSWADEALKLIPLVMPRDPDTMEFLTVKGPKRTAQQEDFFKDAITVFCNTMTSTNKSLASPEVKTYLERLVLFHADDAMLMPC
jgi:hypothetical protein